MIGEFICLRSEMYAFKGGDDSKNELKVNCISCLENIRFEE